MASANSEKSTDIDTNIPEEYKVFLVESLSIAELEDLLKRKKSSLALDKTEAEDTKTDIGNEIPEKDSPECNALFKDIESLSIQEQDDILNEVFSDHDEKEASEKTKGEKEKRDTMHQDQDHAPDSRSLFKGMILENVRIIHILPTGFIWLQFQTTWLKLLEKMQPKVDLRRVPMIDVLEKVRDQLRCGKLYFVVPDGDKKFQRVVVNGRLNDRGSGSDHCVIVEYLDYGKRDIVPVSKLIPLEYFDEVYEQIEPQTMMAVVKSDNPCQAILTEEQMDILLNSDVKIEIFEPEFDEDLPMVVVNVQKYRGKQGKA